MANMFNSNIVEFLTPESIQLLNRIEVASVANVLTCARGIYFWFNKKTDQLVYIGIAVGEGGLRKRIAQQHLNPSYLEYRSQKHSHKDSFQLGHKVSRLGKDDLVRYGIDKSAFRKSIGRKYSIKPGQDTVNFIVNNLYLRICESEDVNSIKLVEKKLIKMLRPELNTAHNSD
jgi:hypothetical protein